MTTQGRPGDAERSPAQSSGGEVPPAIGRPATRALHQAGITTLDEVAEHSEKELLALHGLGPRAIRILTAVLAERGQAFRPDEDAAQKR